MRKLIGVNLFLIDDFALQPLDMLETADIDELWVERHQSKSTVPTSNRDSSEWLGALADPLLAQSPPQERGLEAQLGGAANGDGRWRTFSWG